VLVSADTGEFRDVVNDDPPRLEHPRISPDNRYLVYALRERPDDRESPRNLHLLDLETGQTNQLTFWPGNETTPIWTPRATNIVLFSSDRSGSWDLWGVRIQEGRLSPPFIVRYGVGDYDKRFAADGTLLLHRPTQHGDGYTIPSPQPGEIRDGVEPVPTTMHYPVGTGSTRSPTSTRDETDYPVGTGSTRSPTSTRDETDVRMDGEIRDGVEPVPTITRSLESGIIYFFLDNKLHTMAPDGSQTIMLPPNVAGQPSHALHAGHRWFLQHREVPGDPYPNQEPRREIFAVRGDGDERFTVQLTDRPDQNPVQHPRWSRDPHTGAVDGRISWGTHLWDRTTTNRTLAILAARLQFNDDGQVIGLTDLSDEPLVTGAIDHDWLPDGTRLVYSQNRELRIRDIATGQDTTLAPGREPAWSPDGQRIVFLSENRSIQVIRPDGSELETLVLKPKYPGVITFTLFITSRSGRPIPNTSSISGTMPPSAGIFTASRPGAEIRST
jgi:Tol biopolymer transport system component